MHPMLRCFVWIHSSFLLTKVQAMMAEYMVLLCSCFIGF